MGRNTKCFPLLLAELTKQKSIKIHRSQYDKTSSCQCPKLALDTYVKLTLYTKLYISQKEHKKF
jgi:hypothetical protein